MREVAKLRDFSQIGCQNDWARFSNSPNSDQPHLQAPGITPARIPPVLFWKRANYRSALLHGVSLGRVQCCVSQEGSELPALLFHPDQRTCDLAPALRSEANQLVLDQPHLTTVHLHTAFCNPDDQPWIVQICSQ